MNNEFLQDLNWRGILQQCTNINGLETQLESQTRGYIGFDCTANCLHVGSLLQIVLLQRFQEYGHTPIVLLGGGTTKVGDPSGKDEQRKLLDQNKILENKEGIKKCLGNFIDLNKAIVVDNSNWLEQLNYINFLRDIGKHFSINKMLTFDSVKLRLERQQPLSFLEFNYMLLQAYDFYQLNKNDNCTLQFGGSDQWGNICQGVDLCRRLNGNEVYGITTPLVTKANGEKMGKSASGAIWLDRELTSPYDLWQYFRNVEDQDVIRFLKLFTRISQQEITKLEQLEGAELNVAKELLANELTKLCHGEQEMLQAQNTANNTFSGNIDHNLPSINISNMPTENRQLFKIINQLDPSCSGSEARRLIQANAVKLDDVKQTDPKMVVENSHLANGPIKLSVGKKKHFLIKL